MEIYQEFWEFYFPDTDVATPLPSLVCFWSGVKKEGWIWSRYLASIGITDYRWHRGRKDNAYNIHNINKSLPNSAMQILGHLFWENQLLFGTSTLFGYSSYLGHLQPKHNLNWHHVSVSLRHFGDYRHIQKSVTMKCGNGYERHWRRGKGKERSFFQ
jgi:hypothetical protein